MNRKSLAAAVLGAFAAMASAPSSAAPFTFDTGLIQMGVGDDAGLGVAGVGLLLKSMLPGEADAITPGCLCEGWGASGNALSGYTYGGGRAGINSALLTTTTATNGVSTVELSNGLTVVHTFSSAAGGKLFKVDVSLQNPTGGTGTITDVRYARTLDWDVPPGHFTDDRLTIFVPGGAPAGKVLHTSSNPFAVPDPMVERAQDSNTNVSDAPGDLGGYFILGFGDLADGASVDFTTYIGADDTTAGLLAAFSSVGIEAYTYSYDENPSRLGNTFGWGFAGIGLPPIGTVPEPGSLALLGLGALGLMALRRRPTK